MTLVHTNICLKDSCGHVGEVQILHEDCSDVDACGVQIWPCSIVLVESVLHECRLGKCESPVVLELGAGVGVCAALLSAHVSHYIVTDVHTDVLRLARQNLVDYENVEVHRLDLLSREWPRDWDGEVVQRCIHADVLLVSDVVYDDEVTSALVWWIKHLLELNAQMRVLVAIESRLNFTIQHLRVVDVALEYFYECMEKENLHATSLPLSSIPQYTDVQRPSNIHLFSIKLSSS